MWRPRQPRNRTGNKGFLPSGSNNTNVTKSLTRLDKPGSVKNLINRFEVKCVSPPKSRSTGQATDTSGEPPRGPSGTHDPTRHGSPLPQWRRACGPPEPQTLPHVPIQAVLQKFLACEGVSKNGTGRHPPPPGPPRGSRGPHDSTRHGGPLPRGGPVTGNSGCSPWGHGSHDPN